MAPRDSASSQDWQVQYPEVKMRSAHLLRSREWADCTFKFESVAGASASSSTNPLEAHKLILAMASPVFAAMFYGDVGNKESPVIISDIDLPTFSFMLDYIYTDEVSCLKNTRIAAGLYIAANKYILVHLEKICLDYLLKNLNHHNVCHIYEFSCLYSEDDLKKKCLELISTKTLDVLQGCSFKNAQLSTLKEIFSMNSLNINSELDLFNAMMNYAEHNNINNDVTIVASNKLLAIDNQQSKNECSEGRSNDTLSEISSDPSKKKCEKARQHLLCVTQLIRFLAIDAAELAENSKISSFLTNYEMFALIANASSTKASIPMPDGFSTSREKRNLRFRPKTVNEEKKSQMITVYYTISDFRSIDTDRFGPVFFLQGLIWRAVFGPRQKPQKPKMLGVFLKCEGLKEGWSCLATVEIRLECTEDNAKPYCRKFTHLFVNETRGLDDFIEWRIVKYPLNKYISQDAINVLIYIVAEPPTQTSTLPLE